MKGRISICIPCSTLGKRDNPLVSTRIQNKILANLEPIIRYDMINQKKTPIGFDENRWTLGLDYWIAPSTVVKAAYEFDQQNGQGHSGNAFLLQTVIGF